jgi:hypothetical protein
MKRLYKNHRVVSLFALTAMLVATVGTRTAFASGARVRFLDDVCMDQDGHPIQNCFPSPESECCNTIQPCVEDCRPIG